MVTCEICTKEEEYHTCTTCKKHVCMTCFYEQHFGLNAPRSGKSMVYNKCIFCSSVYAIDAKCSVCDKCTVILTWKSSMNYLAAVNRVSALIKTGQLDPKLKNESFCKTNFGVHATQVIMDALDSSKIR